jgi:hypothetical protein
MLLALTGMLLLAGSASAKDRNHDRIPDRWEKRHHLSLHVNQARKDQDRDGLRNRAEFKSGTDPRDSDTDGDGLSDGSEHAGTIISFDGTTLKISVFGQSDPLVGTVDSSTELECEAAPATTATASHDGPGEDPSDDSSTEPSDDPSGSDDTGDEGDAPHGDGSHGDGDHGDDDQFDEQPCGTDQLTPGMKVKEAELSLHDGVAVFDKLELHP